MLIYPLPSLLASPHHRCIYSPLIPFLALVRARGSGIQWVLRRGTGVPTIQPSTACYRAIVAWDSQESVCVSQQGGVDTVTARSLGRQVVVSDGARERHLRPSYLCSAPSHSAVSSSSTSLPQSSTGFFYYNLLAILPFSGARTALPYRGHSVTLINAMRAMSSSHVEKYLGRDPGPLYVPASSDRKERWRIGDFDDAGPLKKRLI